MTDHVSVDYLVNDATIFSPWVTLVMLVLVIAVVAVAMKGLLITPDGGTPNENSPLEDAERRFAKGEISREELEQLQRGAS
jgi:uncharacterized membrane protein